MIALLGNQLNGLTSADIINLAVLIFVLGLVVVMLVRISRRVRKGGGSMASVAFGATYEFYNKEKKKAIEMIVERNAHKKMDEQSSQDPKKKK